MPPRSSSPICERSLDLTLIGIGRRDIPQCSPNHFLMQMFYRTFSGGQRPSRPVLKGITPFVASAGTMLALRTPMRIRELSRGHGGWCFGSYFDLKMGGAPEVVLYRPMSK